MWRKITPGKTFSEFFAGASDPNVLTPELVRIFAQNQSSVHLSERLDAFQSRKKKWLAELEELKKEAAKNVKPGEEPIDVKNRVMGPEGFLTAAGKFETRNVLAALRISRLLKELPKDAKSKFKLSPSQKLKYAKAAENFCEDRRLANPELAYAGGLHMDWTVALMDADPDAPREAKNAIKEIWKNAFKTAQIAYRISAHRKKLKFSPYIFGSALVIGTGRVWAQWTYRDKWREFLDSTSEFSGARRLITEFQERDLFPLGHNDLAAVLASQLGIFAPVEKAIHFYKYPHYLKHVDSELYQLSLILRVSTILATVTPDIKMTFISQTACEAWEKSYLKELGMTDFELGAIIKKCEEAPG